MIKERNTTIGYHCPFCGMSILHPVNLFSMSGNLIKLKCVCGGSELAVQVKKDGKFRITVPCIVCPNSHSFTVSSAVFFEKALFSFSCTFTSINICFMGRYRKVVEAMQKNEDELLEAFAQYENDYGPDLPDIDIKDNPGFTASFFDGENEGDGRGNNNKNDGKNKNSKNPVLDLFNPLGITGKLDGFDDIDDFDDFDDYDDFDEFDDDFFDFWGDGEFDDVIDGDMYPEWSGNNKKKRKKEPGFKLYKTDDSAAVSNNENDENNQNRSNSKHSQNSKPADIKKMEIKQEIDLNKIKMKSYPIILQILDVVSKLYKEKKIVCKCGDFDGKIVLLENFVHLECKNCGSNRNIKSSNVSDIEYISDMGKLYLDFD